MRMFVWNDASVTVGRVREASIEPGTGVRGLGDGVPCHFELEQSMMPKFQKKQKTNPKNFKYAILQLTELM
jgi:hypothetical protein